MELEKGRKEGKSRGARELSNGDRGRKTIRKRKGWKSVWMKLKEERI